MRDTLITTERLKAYADLPPDRQAEALAEAIRQAALLGFEEAATLAAVYAAPTLALLTSTDASSEAHWDNMPRVIANALRWFARRETPTAETPTDYSEPGWQLRLPAGDQYDPQAAYATTTADLAGMVTAGTTGRTRSVLRLATATPLDTDKPPARVRGVGYVTPSRTQSSLPARYAKATGATDRQARKHVERAINEARETAPHGLTYAQKAHRYSTPAEPFATLPPVDVEHLAYATAPDPTKGCRRIGARFTDADTASAVITYDPRTDRTRIQIPDPDAPHGLRTLTEHDGRTDPEPWLTVLGTPDRTRTDDDRQADGLAAAMTPSGPVRKPNPRKRPRSGAYGPVVTGPAARLSR